MSDGRLSWIWNFFSGKERGTPKAARAEAQGEVPAWQQLEFEQKVRELVHRNDVLLAANVHLLGLSHIREHFQARWSLVSEKVHSLVSKVIEHHLGNDGAYYCYHELTYIIVFAGSSKEAGKLRIALIADEVSRRLFGAVNDGQMVEVKTALLDKSRGLGFESVDFAAIIAQAMEGELAGNRTEVQAPGTGQGTSASPAGTTSPAGEEGTESQPGEPQWKAMRGRASVGRRGTLVENRAGEGGDTAALKAAADAAASSNDWASTSPYASSVVHFVFRPMWRVRQRSVAAYLTVPVRIADSGALLYGADAVPTGSSSSLNVALDLACLQFLSKSAAPAGLGERPPVMIAPVHFVTLTEADYRTRFQDLCHRLPQELGQRIVFELVGLPRGIPQTRLYDVVPLLRTHNSTVLLRLPLDSSDFRDFAAMGFFAAGVDGYALTGPEDATCKAMRRFADLAARHGLRTYIHGLRSSSLISAAMAEGFGVIGGEAIASAGDPAGRAFPFGAKELHAPLVSGLGTTPANIRPEPR